MRILLLSAYDATSHRYWRQGLVRHLPDAQWTCLELPARYFNWRIRGNPLSWALGNKTVLEAGYDLVIATSMVDLATLKGLVPALANTPAILYCHENQFYYPRTAQQHASVDPQMVTLYAALAADRVLFNSAFNRDTFLQGVGALLDKLPDAVPGGVVDLLQSRSAVLPVPLCPVADKAGLSSAASRGDDFTLVWNHRWEYDKAPERLLAGLQHLLGLGGDFKLHLLGERFRQAPPVMEELAALCGERLLSFGYVAEPARYFQCLAASHVVISTSMHEFQGISVLEAVQYGCVPVLPDRLSYRELFDPSFRYASFDADPQREAQALGEHLLARYQQFQREQLPAAPDISRLTWGSLAKTYRQEIEATARSR